MAEGEARVDRAELIRRHWRDGRCCAQAMVAAFLADAVAGEPETWRDMAAGLCGGMGGRRGDCGALSGAALCVGPLLRATGGAAEGAAVRALTADLVERFSQRFGATDCAAVLSRKSWLTSRRRYCEGVTLQTAGILERLLAAAGAGRKGPCSPG